VILTDAEIETAAELLARSSLQRDWATMPEQERAGFRIVVKKLAAELEVKHTPEAVYVFMTWMGGRS
jgi:hypothetical protein